MASLTVRNNEYTFPGDWAELSEKQYKSIAHFLGKDTVANRTATLCKLVGRKKTKLINDLRLVAHVEQADGGGNLLWQILSALDWAFFHRKIDLKQGIHPNIESFQFKLKTYRLPEPTLNDMTIGEWAYVDAYMRAYAQTQKQQHLLQLIATICRPPKSKKERSGQQYDGFPRIPFNPETINRRAEQLKGVPLYVQHAVVDYVSRCTEFLVKRYGPMFEGKSSKGKSYGWEGSITQLAETGVFGTELQVRNTLIHKCCRYTCMKIEKDKQHRKQLEEMKTGGNKQSIL